MFGDNESKNVYYIKKDGGSWTVGTIVSDGSVAIIGFAEDIDVRRQKGALQSAAEAWRVHWKLLALV